MKNTLRTVGKGLMFAPKAFFSVLKSTRSHPFTQFFKAIIRNPKAVGAACPSSRGLAKAMAEGIPMPLDGIVIELGAGTGPVTKAILDRGVPREKLLVLELSSDLCNGLRKRFGDDLNVVQGDAGALSQYIEPGTKIAAVVSSLPLRSLPDSLVKKIAAELTKIMDPGSALIQFTYNLKAKYIMDVPMNRTGTKIIWRNIPPARVDIGLLADKKAQANSD